MSEPVSPRSLAIKRGGHADAVNRFAIEHGAGPANVSNRLPPSAPTDPGAESGKRHPCARRKRRPFLCSEGPASAEIAMVGNEGIVGIHLFMGRNTTPSRAIVQSAGQAYRLKGNLLRDEFERHGPTMHLLLRYTQALMAQMAQTAVCNRHHSIDQQLCRWLLLNLDRSASNELRITQESIANMPGVRRESVPRPPGSCRAPD